VNDLYLKASTSLKVHADGTIDLGNFEDMLAAKLGEYLFPTMYRGAQDAAVRLEAMTRGKSFKNIKAAVPNLDVVPETALESLANYVISLSRQITQNETDELKAALDEGMRQGLSLDTITKNIKTAINENATFKAERIARTETARAYITGQSVTWREAGVEKVEPILAPNSCTLCADLVSKGAYPIDTRRGDRVPFHPNCRCDEVPVLE
jgi:SPP1 gp7 family putative phage head morphogenesis protein